MACLRYEPYVGGHAEHPHISTRGSLHKMDRHLISTGIPAASRYITDWYLAHVSLRIRNFVSALSLTHGMQDLRAHR